MDKEWYFLGLWLGDGAKDAVSITSADSEIIEYLKSLGEKYNLKVSLYKTKSKAYEINFQYEKRHSREIYKYDLNDNFICKYDSLKEAAEDNNILQSNISHAASGRYKYSGGYKWKYGKVLKFNYLRTLLESFNLLNNKHIPKEIFQESENNKKLFLAGLIDSDGTRNYQTISISQKDNNIIIDLKLLCESLGYLTRVRTVKIKNTNYYILTLKGDLRDLPILLPRKLPTKISRFNG